MQAVWKVSGIKWEGATLGIASPLVEACLLYGWAVNSAKPPNSEESLCVLLTCAEPFQSFSRFENAFPSVTHWGREHGEHVWCLSP